MEEIWGGEAQTGKPYQIMKGCDKKKVIKVKVTKNNKKEVVKC
jgi:hypothetical protein